MGLQLLGDPMQRMIERNGSLMSPQDLLEDIQCYSPKWYFTRQELEEQSPSRKDGISFKKETVLRSLYCSFLLDLGMKLKVPQVTIATAMMLCHRFYLRQSHAKNEWQTIATVSMFLACKVEETPRLLKDVVVVGYETMYKRDRTAAQRIKQKDVYEKQKELIVIAERLLLVTIGFDLNIQHPYKPLVAALKRLDISHNDLAKVAWNFVNDWLRTTLCLEYKPHYVAAGSMYLAAKFHKVKLPSEKGKVWWLEFDVTPQRLEEVIQEMLTLLENNKNPLMPFSREKMIQPTAVKKASSSSPQSCVLNGSNATNNSRSGVDVKAGGDVRLHESSGACKSQNVSNEDECVNRKEEVSQCQTSDCGSTHSVVEDGNRSDEGEVQARVEVESNQTASCKVISDVDEGVLQARMVVESNQTASCKVFSDIDKGESQARMGLESNQTANCEVVSTIDEGEPQARVMLEFNQTASCKVVPEGKPQARTVLESSQTASCKAVSCIIDVAQDQASVAVEFNQTSSSKVISDVGGLIKIDKDRIREALKKRKHERMTNKKVVTAKQDDDSWIVRELEDAIDMQYAPAEKKQRL